jgi:hypothetical protein
MRILPTLLIGLSATFLVMESKSFLNKKKTYDALRKQLWDDDPETEGEVVEFSAHHTKTDDTFEAKGPSPHMGSHVVRRDYSDGPEPYPISEST